MQFASVSDSVIIRHADVHTTCRIMETMALKFHLKYVHSWNDP